MPNVYESDTQPEVVTFKIPHLSIREKIPPRVDQTTENPEETFQGSTVPPPEDYCRSYCNEETERVRFLVDTGAGINLIKETTSLNAQTSSPKTFLMGNDKHTTKKFVT
jgi:hypothetical protein